jgi:type II secretory pathway predicted ATPase ExeA
MSMTRLELFVNLGLRKDPFKGVVYETGDSIRVRKILTMAVESRAMVNIIGERGIGKTESVKAALARIGAKVVTVEKSDKDRVTIGDIEMAMILDLCSEQPKGGEKLSRQVRPILGAAAAKGKTVLLLEEAQRLHVATLKSLKTLREKSWMGESELFTVVLVGQSNPMARAGLAEVQLRTDCVWMQGLTSMEAAGYVQETLGRFFEAAAIEALSELPEARNFLELQGLCVTVLSHALLDGREKAAVEDVDAFSASRQAELPRTAGRKAAGKQLSGRDALQSVLGKRGGAADDGKEATAC